MESKIINNTKLLSIAWFEKRCFDWEGLSILLDDKAIEHRAKRLK